MEGTMKRLLSVCLLMLCLSFPALAGHNVIGGAYCEPCDNVTCICDEQDRNRTNSTQDESSDLGSEVLLSLFVLLVLLRYKA
jgi:hypothetical protein